MEARFKTRPSTQLDQSPAGRLRVGRGVPGTIAVAYMKQDGINREKNERTV